MWAGMKSLMLGVMVMVMLTAQLNSGCDPGVREPAVDAAPAADAAPMMGRCGRTAPDPGTNDLFARAQYGMIATWRGTATSPWVAPYTVEISFAADGTYDAHTVNHKGVNYPVTPFYYDRDPEHDRYELVDLHANHDVSGKIYLEWLTSPDTIDALRFNDDLTHLHFEYSHFGYGPILYDLDCTP